MEERSLRILEFDRIRTMLREHCVCEKAKAATEALFPTPDIYEARAALELTGEAEMMIIQKGGAPIVPVGDITAALGRAKAGGVLTLGELLCAAHVLGCARALAAYGADINEKGEFPRMEELFSKLKGNKHLEKEIISAVISEEELADDASAKLLSLRRKMRGINASVRELLNNMIHSPKYAPYLQDSIVTTRGGRYVIPVKSENKAQILGIVHDTSSSGATLFVEPMAAVEYGNRMRALKAEEKNEIERIVRELSAQIGECAGDIAADYEAVIEIDFAFAKGSLLRKMNGCIPALNADGIIDIKRGRHPLIDPSRVVPTDIYLGRDFDTLVITGPNTGGKTVALKSLGLFTLMAQSGLGVPCATGSTLAVFENVFADIGDEQSIEQSLSTFSAHMTSITDILKKADYKSLILFDELCSGTDPTEGAALAVAILERTRLLGAKCAATTHYSELKLYALSTKRVENAACEFDVASLRPTYRLLIGIPGKSNAFAISEKLGLDKDIISYAQTLLTSDNTRFEDVISTLEKRSAEAEIRLTEADEAQRQSRQKLEASEKQLSSAAAEREKILANARRDAKSIYDRAKAEADRIVREMQKKLENASEESRRAIEENRRSLKRSAEDMAASAAGDAFTSRSGKKLSIKDIKLGQNVCVTTMNQIGTVLSLPDKKGDLTVQTGVFKIKTNVAALAQAPKEKKSAKKPQTGFVSTSPRSAVKGEIDLRGETVDDALLILDKYLDDASLMHYETVSIIHGKGTGALKNAVGEMLRHHPHAKSYRGGLYGEGDGGVTVVELK